MEKIIDIVAIIVYVAAGFPIFKEALNNIRHGEIFDENFLMCVASLGSAIMGEFTEAAMVMVLYRIGEYLQDRAVGKSRKAITDLLNICPEFAFVEKNGQIVQVDVDEIDAGDIIVVKPGDRIPADGVVVNGSSRIDTAAITGEALPKNAGEGSQVYSGTINLDGLLKIKLSAKAEESTAARIIELVEDAAANRAKSEKFITKFAKVYTPVVCGVALAVSVLPPLLFKGLWTEWIYRGLCFLVVSCPCALVISIPLGFFAGIGAASSRGILIKGSNYLEALSKTDIMIFDKTGTLTKGVFKVVAVHPHELEKERLLELATLAESFSNHPIARSLADEYGKFVDKSRVSEFKEFAGKGVSAVVDGLKINVGNAKLMESLGIEYHDCEIPGTIVHVALDKKYVGHITISDEIKDDAKATIDGLRNMGLSKLVMLTGDKETIAKHVAQALDVDEFHGDLMPEDKLKIAGDFKTQLADKKMLAFVGDGINDAPVLTKADLGIAMGGMGSAAAVEAADIVLMNDKPSDLLIALSIAQKSMKIIYENIYGAIGIKVAVLILTLFGISNMWLALFADVGVCLLAILNSMRALRVNK